MRNRRLRASGAIHCNVLAFRNVFLVEQPVTCTGGVAIHYNILAFGSVFPVEQPVTCTGGVQATALPSTDIHWCFLLRCHVVNARNVGTEIPAMLSACCIQQHADTCFGAFAV